MGLTQRCYKRSDGCLNRLTDLLLRLTCAVLTPDLLAGLSQEPHFPDDLWRLSLTRAPRVLPGGGGGQHSPSRRALCPLSPQEAKSSPESDFQLFPSLSPLGRLCWFLAVDHSPSIFHYTQIGWFTLPVLSRSECDHAGCASGGHGFGS